MTPIMSGAPGGNKYHFCSQGVTGRENYNTSRREACKAFGVRLLAQSVAKTPQYRESTHSDAAVPTAEKSCYCTGC